MTAHPLVTLAHGRAPQPPRAPQTTEDVECYHTDDGQLLLVLAGRRPAAATALAAELDVRDPTVEVCDHLDTVTTTPPESGIRPGFHAWITITTTVEHQRALAEFNLDETRSTLRHLPGFRSATVFLGRDRPTVSELVIWESEQHYRAAERRPDFAEHHLRHIEQVATDTTWHRVRPCAHPTRPA